MIDNGDIRLEIRELDDDTAEERECTRDCRMLKKEFSGDSDKSVHQDKHMSEEEVASHISVQSPFILPQDR